MITSSKFIRKKTIYDSKNWFVNCNSKKKLYLSPKLDIFLETTKSLFDLVCHYPNTAVKYPIQKSCSYELIGSNDFLYLKQITDILSDVHLRFGGM